MNIYQSMTEQMFPVYVTTFLSFYPLMLMYYRIKLVFDKNKPKLIRHINIHHQQYLRCIIIALAIVILEHFSTDGDVFFSFRGYLAPSHLIHAFFIGCVLAVALQFHNNLKADTVLSHLMLIIATVIILQIIITGLNFSSPPPEATMQMVASKLIGFHITYQQIKAWLKTDIIE